MNHIYGKHRRYDVGTGVYNKIFRMQLAHEKIKKEEELEFIQQYL